VSHSEDDSKKQEAWKLLSEAGLVDIGPDEFADRIKEAKNIVLRRLNELLELTSNIGECQSTAYSLGTLRRLETTIGGTHPSTRPLQSDEPDK
jgi:hypothetical protein